MVAPQMDQKRLIPSQKRPHGYVYINSLKQKRRRIRRQRIAPTRRIRRDKKRKITKRKNPKTKEKRKTRKKLGRMVAPVNNFPPKTIARRISEAAIGAGGRGTHISLPLWSSGKKKVLTWAAQVR